MPQRFVILFAGTLAGVIAAFAVVLAIPSPSASADQSLDSEEQAFIILINNYRAQNGLGALSIDWSIQPASDWMSADLGINAYFDHYDHCTGNCVTGHQYDASVSRDPWARMCQVGGYCYNTWMGENIAGGFTTAQAVFTAWQNSPGHNANMLGSHYTAMGIARVYKAGSPYTWYWTNDFGGVNSNVVPPGSTATPAPTASPSPAPTPTPVPTAFPAGSSDTDTDGYADSMETFVGTSTVLACPQTSIANDEAVDAIPVDFDDDGTVNGSDLLTFASAVGAGINFAYESRHDLNMDYVVNGSDLLDMSAVFGQQLCN